MSELLENVSPERVDREVAFEVHEKLIEAINKIDHSENIPEIIIQETGDPIKIPLKVLKLMAEVLDNFRQGNGVAIIPTSTMLTTQKTAELLNCSRPHVVKLIDSGELPAEKIGRHRRIKLTDVIDYKRKMIEEQKKNLVAMMKHAEEHGLYETD